MAYSKTPEQSTYKTERFSFIGTPQQRTGATLHKDQRFVNAFPEMLKSSIGNAKQYYLRQRAGLTKVQDAVGTGAPRGICYFNGSKLTAVGNTLYKDGVSFQVLDTSTGTVGFCEYNGLDDYLIVLDGVAGWTIKKSDWTVTKITDADFPSPHIPAPLYMDGFLFVVKSGTADVYNSVLEDPLSWEPGEFFTAELYPDAVVAAVKAKNYLTLIGTKTTEYLYNAATPSGSPLGRNDTAVQQFGTPAPDSVCQSEGEFFMIGDTGAGGRSVWSVKDFKATEIGIEPVKQSLDSQGASISGVTGYIVRTGGHKFYVLNLTDRTWVYDVDEKMWHEWSYGDDTQPFHCNYACEGPNGEPYFLGPAGEILTFDYTHTLDDGVPVFTTLMTAKLDFESMNRKFCHRFSMVCDDPDSGTPTISVSWSDDDYKTWSNPRTLDIGLDLPTARQLGMFRRRSFKVTYAGGGVPLRFEGFELDINIGQH